MRSGSVTFNGHGNEDGLWGHYWSITSATSTHARALDYSDAFMASSGGDDRYHGFPLRCLVR